MCRREVMDAFLRDRSASLGTHLVNGLVTKIDTGAKRQGPYTLTYSDYAAGEATGETKTLEVDLIVGADGANSRVAKAMDAGDYNVAIAFQERIKLPPEEMKYYEDLAEMYVGTDVSPDFYAWVFPKYDHVAVGTGTMQKNQALIKGLQQGIRERASNRLLKGEVIKVEAHPIPEHPRPRRVVGRMALVGDAAGYVTKSSGEGIYFAAKSGRMCAEEIVAASQGGQRIPTEADLKLYIKKWDKKYGSTYKVLEILQNIFYSNDAAREAFVEMCDDKDVQRLTFDSYLYKRVVAMNPWQQLKLTFLTLASVLRGQALAPSSYRPVASAVRSPEEVEAMKAVSAIKGGIRVRRPVASSDTSASTPGTADAQDRREPALAGKP
jgi:geranylgeranyl reductase